MKKAEMSAWQCTVLLLFNSILDTQVHWYIVVPLCIVGEPQDSHKVDKGFTLSLYEAFMLGTFRRINELMDLRTTFARARTLQWPSAVPLSIPVLGRARAKVVRKSMSSLNPYECAQHKSFILCNCLEAHLLYKVVLLYINELVYPV